MKEELGIARCGLACCLCSENAVCGGCDSGNCPDAALCECRRCSIEKGYAHCYECPEECKKGILAKSKPYGFTEFARRYGEKRLLECLRCNEENGIIYHRSGITGDYDGFDRVEDLLRFIETGEKEGSVCPS